MSLNCQPLESVSAFIVCLNEADRIAHAIEALKDVADDIVVIDSGSKDETASIARGLGARVFFNNWTGYGPQKRFGEERCLHDWVINVDADEVLSEELVREIRLVFSTGLDQKFDAFMLGIVEIFPGEERPAIWAYTIPAVRLYRLSRGRYSESSVHDRVVLNNASRVGRLKSKIYHRSVRSLAAQLRKLDAYSDMQVADLISRRVRIPTWRILTEFQTSFWKAYIGRRHALRGLYGFLTAMNYAISRHVRLAKYFERTRGAGEN